MRIMCQQVLILCVLMCLVITSASAGKTWKCSGKPTTYTYTDCETDKSLTDGCYYLVHFEQYRPCNDICDGVEMWSIDEERCRSYCPGYLSSFCKIEDKYKLVVTKVEPPTSQTTPYDSSTVTTVGSVTTQQTSLPQELVYWAVIGGLSLLCILIGIVVIVLLLKRRRQTPRNPKSGIHDQTQLSDEEAQLERSKCYSEKTIQPTQATLDNNYNTTAEMFVVEENKPMVMTVD